VSPFPTRPLGSTGEQVSCIGVGGAHLGKKEVDEKLAIRIVRTAIDEGITFLDNSWVNAVRAKTKEAAANGEYELFKTSSLFDSTAEHPEWLGEEPKQLQAMISE
jgi:predicted aldo/keto reductase-like oxidoreductase